MFYRKYCKVKASKSTLREVWNCEEQIIEMAFWLVDNNENTAVSLDEDCNRIATFCGYCAKLIKKNMRPDLALADSLDLPTIPNCLRDITRLEERLVAARHVFQSIWAIQGGTGQYKSKGGIVNVPVNVDTTVSVLPRKLDDSYIIHLSLARKLVYKKDYIKGNISPSLVWRAANFLQEQPLYVDYQIGIDSEWIQIAESEIEQATLEEIFSEEAVDFNEIPTDDGSANEDINNDINEEINPNDNETYILPDEPSPIDVNFRIAPAEMS